MSLKIVVVSLILIVFSKVLYANEKAVVVGTSSISTVKKLSHDQFQSKVEATNSIVIIDVRTPSEFAQGYVPNAINIPHKDILANMSILKQYKGKELIFYCRSGRRAASVMNALINENTLNGDTIYHLDGDMNAWKGAGLSLER